jgi:uncharacterized RDD family membrane protein YckC
MRPVEELSYTLSTPEGVPISCTLAPIASRLLALILDGLLLGLLGMGILLLVWLSAPILLASDGFLSALLLLVVFVLRNFYFVLAEIYLGGQTLGKRVIKLRVICRDGGPITPGILLARNLTRELELFFPLAFLAQPEMLVTNSPGIIRLASIFWLVALVLLPMMNQHRARLGDLIAGTLVIRAPEHKLMPDLTEETSNNAFTFSESQLSIYGIKELQALEGILRVDEQRQNLATLESVSEKIQKKIRWQGAQSSPEVFLQAFYAAQRKRLEKELLFGRRKEEKSVITNKEQHNDLDEV